MQFRPLYSKYVFVFGFKNFIISQNFAFKTETWLCDHKPDCGLGDNSDEEDCAFEVCDDALQFTCRNKRCIPLANVCDGMDSCGDASDEWQCKKKGCNNDTEFSCDKTKCLPMMLRCKYVGAFWLKNCYKWLN